VFNEVFGTLTGVTVAAPPRPGGTGPLADRAPDPGQHADRYERVSRRLDVSARDGRLRMVTTMTGNLATLTASEPEELLLHPADSSGAHFVARSRDDDPWVPVSFGQLSDGTPYLSMGGRVTPRTA
jgi:hypothetical protein